jgi:hypothetical protein
MQTSFLKLIVTGSLAACGGSALDPGAGSDPGTGTATLVVTGSISAQAHLTNALTAADFDTQFSVRITLNTQTVTTGTVTITSTSGTYPLTFQPNGQGNGQRWAGMAPAYDEVYRLDVDSGVDNVHNVRIDGPSLHSFTAPTAGAQVDSTMPVMLTWRANDAAESAALRTDRIDNLAIPDTGTYMMAAGSLKSAKDQAEQNTIRLTRTNRVTPAGGAAGSELAASVENEIDVVALINPNAP